MSRTQFKVEIKKNPKEYNEYTLTLKGATAGKILAIMNACENSNSPLAQELALFIHNEAIQDEKNILDI